MDNAELLAKLEQLKAENEALKAKQQKAPAMTIKVSPKGAIAIYGLGKFPVTLYQSQMTRLLDKSDEIRAFMAANAANLKVKGA